MTTDFLIQRRKIVRALTGFLLVFVYSILFFSYSLRRTESVYVGKNFYFLVSLAESIEVGVYDAQFDGGAGYLFTHDGQEYVAIAVYLSVSDANAVQAGLRLDGEETGLKQAGVERLYFSTKSEKSKKKTIVSALNCLYQYITLLESEITRLSKGGTQESSKRILRILSKQFSYLAEQFGEMYKKFAEYCKEVAEEITAETKKTVYVGRLRYILCDMCVNYLEFSKVYAL